MTDGGTEQNHNESVEWFKKAALQGYSKAQTHLGLRYAIGIAVQRNDLEAYAWLKLEAEQGDDLANANIEFVSRRMSPAEIDKATARIATAKSLGLHPKNRFWDAWSLEPPRDWEWPDD